MLLRLGRVAAAGADAGHHLARLVAGRVDLEDLVEAGDGLGPLFGVRVALAEAVLREEVVGPEEGGVVVVLLRLVELLADVVGARDVVAALRAHALDARAEVGLLGLLLGLRQVGRKVGHRGSVSRLCPTFFVHNTLFGFVRFRIHRGI